MNIHNENVTFDSCAKKEEEKQRIEQWYVSIATVQFVGISIEGPFHRKFTMVWELLRFSALFFRPANSSLRTMKQK